MSAKYRRDLWLPEEERFIAKVDRRNRRRIAELVAQGVDPRTICTMCACVHPSPAEEPTLIESILVEEDAA